jgi:predicted RNA-binding protein with PIN domain
MPYLIDGHNLIPKIPGLSLAALDDEMQLVELLQEFCRRIRKQAEIYFDNAPPGQPRMRSFGSVKARFVRTGQTADAAIRARLVRLGGAARNWTVVSSDQQVLAAAHAARAQAVTSEMFARQILQALRQADDTHAHQKDSTPSPEEVDEWLELFGDDTQE